MEASLAVVYDFLYEKVKMRAAEFAGAAEAQCSVWEGRKPAMQPLLLHCAQTDQGSMVPIFSSREIHFDKDKMLISQMARMAGAATGGMQAVPSVRANMGCNIFPSLFPGILPELFDDERMPWIIKHLDKETISKLKPSGLRLTDEFKLGLEHTAYLAEKIEGTGAYVYPMDLQNPVDVAHLVYGDNFFYDLYDDPLFIDHLLDLSCTAIELGIAECLKAIPGSDKIVTHYNELAMPRSGGGLKFSEDTSTLLSEEHIHRFTLPSLSRLLESTGGGYVHFCGHNKHLLEACLKTGKVRGINFGNPEKYDMEEVLRRLAKAGKVYYGNIPMNEDEKKNEDYASCFARLRKAATDQNGCCRLLLSMYANDAAQAEKIRSAWKALG